MKSATNSEWYLLKKSLKILVTLNSNNCYYQYSSNLPDFSNCYMIIVNFRIITCIHSCMWKCIIFIIYELLMSAGVHNNKIESVSYWNRLPKHTELFIAK